MKRLRVMLALLAGSGCGIVTGAGPELSDTDGLNIDEPDAELLEFLGSWAGEDDEWQAFFDSLPYTHDESLQAGEPENKDEQENDR